MKRSVIIFGGALYDSPLWTNRQHVATRLAQEGWRVFYVEPRLFLFRVVLGRFPGTGGKWRWVWRSQMPAKVGEHFWVMAQLNILPSSRRVGWISLINHLFNAWAVLSWAKLLGFGGKPAVLICDTEAAQYVRAFRSSRIVYDCVDDHRAQAGVQQFAGRVDAEERVLASAADAVAVTTPPLLEKFRFLARQVVLVPNAADVHAFLATGSGEPSEMRGIPHPRLGTVGALDAYKIDVSLLATLARHHPDWHFVLVGPVEFVGGAHETVSEETITSLERFPNVHFLGAKPKEDIPAYVHAFDVAIIPYRQSVYNASSFPLKFWEFMASGVPVVASGLPSLTPFHHLAILVSGEEQFAEGIRAALQDTVEAKQRRVAEARRHDWASRARQIASLLTGEADAMPAVDSGVLPTPRTARS